MNEGRKLKIGFLTVDAREDTRQYEKPNPFFGTAPEALLQGFAQWPDIEVHVLSCLQQPVTPRQKLAENIWFHGLHVPKIGWLRTGYQGCIRAVRRELRAIKPDLVHGQGTEREAAIGAALSGHPNVLTIHGNMRLISRVNQARPFSYQWLAARLESFTIPRSDGVVCITRYTQDAVRSLARRTWLLPNAVDQKFFELTLAPAEPPEVLCAGHIILRKNQNRFIEALDSVAAKHPFKVIFMGAAAPTDPYAEEFFRLVTERPWCEYRGVANREQLRAAVSRASIMALPSLEENCPMVVLEAMAAGVPVMAAKVGGVPDLIDDGRTGVFCDPLDAASMARAVKLMLSDGALRVRLAAEGKKEALRRFHPQVIAQRHLEIYREVLRSSS